MSGTEAGAVVEYSTDGVTWEIHAKGRLADEKDRADRSIRDHMHIIEALEARDTARAETLVRDHALDRASQHDVQQGAHRSADPRDAVIRASRAHAARTLGLTPGLGPRPRTGRDLGPVPLRTLDAGRPPGRALQ